MNAILISNIRPNIILWIVCVCVLKQVNEPCNELHSETHDYGTLYSHTTLYDSSSNHKLRVWNYCWFSTQVFIRIEWTHTTVATLHFAPITYRAAMLRTLNHALYCTLSRSDSRKGTICMSSESVSSTNQLEIGTPLDICSRETHTVHYWGLNTIYTVHTIYTVN